MTTGTFSFRWYNPLHPPTKNFYREVFEISLDNTYKTSCFLIYMIYRNYLKKIAVIFIKIEMRSSFTLVEGGINIVIKLHFSKSKSITFYIQVSLIN